jgi:hypothetical protein
MRLAVAADGLMELFGGRGQRARRGALLLAAALLANRPELPHVILDLDEE